LTATEPELRAVIMVAFLDFQDAEAAGNVLAAMRATRELPYANAPALAGIYGVALVRLDGMQREKIRNEGLESDPTLLLISALKAYPYDPEYWYALALEQLNLWNIDSAFVLLDTAMTMPVPAAVRAHAGLQDLSSLVDRIQRDFPAFSIQE
jgi:hypothetical protein